MLKKHGKEIIFCILCSVVVVFGVLGLVYICEYFNIHVPGSREMWIGFLGAVIGGCFTLIGVLITIYKQEEVEAENRRLENMPILGFKVCEGKKEANTLYTYIDEEIITTAFCLYQQKEWVVIEVSVTNEKCAFDFIVEQVVINGKEIRLGSTFNPSKERINVGESTSIAFDDEVINNCNFWCVMRTSYKDIFGNKYYQDLPFTYMETSWGKIGDEEQRIQMIDIRDIKQPILVETNKKSLHDSLTEYIDYETFCTK